MKESWRERLNISRIAINAPRLTIAFWLAVAMAGILDRETANLRAYKLKNEIAQIQGRLDQLPPDNLTIIARAVAFPQFWRDLSEIERRFYFREFIRRIEIERETANNWHLRLIFVF